MAFNFDGQSPRELTIGATGGYRMNIEIRGLASHAGGHPEKGISAIAIAALAIADLVENGWHGLIEKQGKRGTSNVGVIHGGTATNVVTDCVKIRAEARATIPSSASGSSTRSKRHFTVPPKRCEHGGRVRRGHDRRPTRLRIVCTSHERARRPAANAAVEAVGLTPEINISNGGLDANWLTAHGIPTVTLGCGQNNIHTTAEWLDSGRIPPRPAGRSPTRNRWPNETRRRTLPLLSRDPAQGGNFLRLERPQRAGNWPSASARGPVAVGAGRSSKRCSRRAARAKPRNFPMPPTTPRAAAITCGKVKGPRRRGRHRSTR